VCIENKVMIHDNENMTHSDGPNIRLPGRAARYAEIAGKVNAVLERMMPVLTPAGIILGVLFSAFYIKLKPLVPWLFGAMTLSGALKLKFRDLIQVIKNPLPIIIFFVSAHVLMPVLSMLISGLVFPGDPDTVSGYVLIYSVPTAVSGFIWVSIYRGNPALSLALILIDTILAPIVVPGTVRILLGTKVFLDMSGMALSLIYMVVIPTIIGVAVNETSKGKLPKIISPYFTPFSKFCLFLVVSANCAPVASQVNLENPRLWIIAAMCIGFTVLGFVCGKFIGVLGDRLRLLGNPSDDKQVSVFFATGLRNISAAMTLGIQYFPAAAALPTVLGIVFQQSIAALMGKFMLKKLPAAAEDK